MEVGNNPAVDPGLMKALVRHLEHLERHPDGGELLMLINDALHHCRDRHLINGSCLAHLQQQLLVYSRQLGLTSPIRLRVRLILQHLAIFLPNSDQVIPAQAHRPAMKPTPLPDVAASQPVEPAPHPRSADVPSALDNRQKPESPAGKGPSVPTAVTARPPQNMKDLRHLLADGMDEMLRERETLARKLADANTYLKMIEAEREQLREELGKARRRIRSGDKPSRKTLGLPKRDVLVRQIESEVERVKRHGNPLALALLDIDKIEDIHDLRGADFAEGVLNRYTSEVLGRFRSYDMVARYNKREFAVLLPHTGKDNALRALEKVQKRAKETHFSHNGRSYPLPGFRGVLTLYSPGEEPQQMLRRADDALVNLKLRDQHQLVVV